MHSYRLSDKNKDMFPSDCRILIVDDIQSMRRQLKILLGGLGFKNFTEAENGNVAFQLLMSAVSEKHPYDLILCDLNMPELDGIQLLKKVRANNIFNTLPFLMVTAVEEMDKVNDAVQAGVTNYLVKPITASVLSKKLQEVWLSQKSTENFKSA